MTLSSNYYRVRVIAAVGIGVGVSIELVKFDNDKCVGGVFPIERLMRTVTFISSSMDELVSTALNIDITVCEIITAAFI